LRRQVVLTVSESKRLIAKGVAAMPSVKRALESGMVVIATGSTNSYVVEELLGKEIDKTAYRSGLTLPMRPQTPVNFTSAVMPDIVLRNGEVVEELDRFSAPAEMKAGDVYLKGCNALNYQQKLAGILIGSESAGTIGATIGQIVGRRIQLIVPVGLEKEIGADVLQVTRLLAEACEYATPTPRMMPVWGEIITEIEAIDILTGLRATHIGSGGVGGAEGGIWLLLDGDASRIDAAAELIDSIQGEPPWI
jgi:hypothetical protein